MRMTTTLTFRLEGKDETFTGSRPVLKRLAAAYQNWYSAAESHDKHERVVSTLPAPAAAHAELEAAKAKRTAAYNALVEADHALSQIARVYCRAREAAKTRRALAAAADRCRALLYEAMEETREA